jgi:hypothetical protein
MPPPAPLGLLDNVARVALQPGLVAELSPDPVCSKLAALWVTRSL